MFKFKFMPEDKKFFKLFNELSRVLVEIVHEFAAFLKNFSSNGGQSLKIRELEQKGNKIAAELMKELSSNFVTPLDREDIHGLTKILNGIIDHVHGVAIRFEMYNIDKIRSPAIRMSEVLSECVEELQLLITQLNNMSALELITPGIDKLDKYEEKGDVIYRKAIYELFHSEIDTLEVLKWKDIYERIENNIDKCNDAGNIILGIIFKYA
jgi:predicted phosphate transport protein (TIGR00153 family)